MRAEDVQRIVQEALLQQVFNQLPVRNRFRFRLRTQWQRYRWEDRSGIRTLSSILSAWKDSRRCDPLPMEVSQSQKPQMVG